MPGEPSATANFALTYYAVDGTPGTDTTTSMNIQHDQRTITLSGSAATDDDKPFAALKGISVVDPYAGDQVGAVITVEAGDRHPFRRWADR